MLGQTLPPDTASQYKEIIMTLRQKFHPHFNVYMKKYLLLKQQCYKKPNQAPVTPEQYYPCMDRIDEEMYNNSSKLMKLTKELEDEDAKCTETCRRSFEIEDKRAACVSKCIKKYGEGLQMAYQKYYDEVVGQESDYKRLKK